MRTLITVRAGGTNRSFFIAPCERGRAVQGRDPDERPGRRLKKAPNFVTLSNRIFFGNGGPAVGPAHRTMPRQTARASMGRRCEEAVIGIPQVLNLYSTAPFFRSYFEALGAKKVVFSGFSNDALLRHTLGRGSIDPCFPSKVAVAHVYELLRLPSVTHIFFPCIRTLRGEIFTTEQHWSCPVVAATPEVVKASLTLERDEFGLHDVAFLDPVLDISEWDVLERQMLALVKPLFGVGRRRRRESLEHALDEWDRRVDELRGAAEALVADVEAAYWDFCLAGDRIAIYEESLRLAEQQRDETRARIDAGKLAGTELAAARAEVASRTDALIGAKGALETARIGLLRLLGPPGGRAVQGPASFWSREVKPLDRPASPAAGPSEVDEHVAKALAGRPDLNQARLAIERGELELVRTRNGLLPKLDLFVELGQTGYADSFSSAFDNLDENYQYSAGLALEYALGNRSARAKQRRAEISRAEAELALENLAQLAQLDVRTSHVAAVTARERIAATAAARALQDEALRAETEKFRVGKSTTFQVAQAQRDLVSARIAEVEAVVGYLQALVELYRADGSLLERRGVSTPGGAPR